ncbi:hypothetical protein COZ73_02030 [Candidatus Falkowbacteria bacterium CG_4_8_14_3_um_filter_36_11]|nr:MAG: hypothetical protein COZ73_02030 [Candidatus Falkowbacteria bacterium CG_4_8_14_3_um_filter_36_11]
MDYDIATKNMDLIKVKKLNIPSSPGCYEFYNRAGEIIYIGKASGLRNRVLSYWQKSASYSPAKNKMLAEINSIKLIEVDSEIEALLLEANLIKKYQPKYNILLRDDKRFSYIKISIADEIPGIFITRNIDKAGKYFGPYTSSTAVRETVKAIRKIWPYCTNRKKGIKPCFYYQINRCLGICAGKINQKEYKQKVTKPIILFLEGKKNKIIKNYELQIKNLEKKIKKFNPVSHNYLELESEIRKIKYKLINIKNVLEHTKIISLSDKYVVDVVELAKILNFKKVPDRIEGYDIANIFGREAVGSMVVFSNGEPDKSQYRKFKIKTGEGQANDIRMLIEVLERRFKHSDNLEARLPSLLGSLASKWPIPDLIIVDGGKGQLNVILSVLKKNKLEIPALAIAKGQGLRSAQAPDKIFFPGEKKPLELPLASPALHLIKRVRDEAHRFAISYHKLRRKKRMFGK